MVLAARVVRIVVLVVLFCAAAVVTRARPVVLVVLVEDVARFVAVPPEFDVEPVTDGAVDAFFAVAFFAVVVVAAFFAVFAVFFAAGFVTGALAFTALRTATVEVRAVRARIGPRKRPVWLASTAATCSGVP
ncbi:MAG: hypothetical protein ABIS35_03795, partial [Terracoccus sp.]